MKIAVVQLDAGETGTQRRMEAIEAAVFQAQSRGGRIAVLPELAISGYGAGEKIAGTAGDIDGSQISWLKSLALRSGCAIVIGLALKTDGKVRNSAIFVTPDGTAATYEKIHLYGDYEKTLFVPGRRAPPVLSFEGLTFGLLVCFDVEFPERVRDLALRGAEAVFVPTALPKSDGGAFIAQSVLPVRAFENQVFIAYANHAGQDQNFVYQGLSCIAAPDGQLLAKGPLAASGLLLADIDPGAYEACRVQNPYLDEVRGCSDLEC